MEDQEFVNQLAEKLSKLGTVRPLGFHYLHPYGTVPADSIICNGATYSRALYKDFFDYITTQGWVKTEAEWQKIATRDNGFCPFYSSGDGSTNFRTPKFAPYQQVTMEVAKATTYHQAGLPDLNGDIQSWLPLSESNLATGVFKNSVIQNTEWAGLDKNWHDVASTIRFKASDCSPVSGRTNTVQPESHEWVMCVVVYGIATTQVQAEIADIQQAIGNITKFAAPAYGSGSTIAANKTVTIQSNGFLLYHIHQPGTSSKTGNITINGTGLTVESNDFSHDRGILPVLKGDSVRHNNVDELMFYPARYGV